MSDNPYSSPRTECPAPITRSRGWAATLLSGLFAFAIVGILVALLLPATRSSKLASRRMTCANNLKQIGLALHNYESVYHALPPAYTVDANGKPLHSWRTLILPFLEQAALYETIDLAKPWNDPANKAARETSLAAYRCPSADCPQTHTTYLAIVAPGGVFLPGKPRTLAEITDSLDLTLMIVETDARRAVHWMSPHDSTERAILNPAELVANPHPPGVMGALSVSGFIHYMRSDLPPEKIRALLTIDGQDDELARGEF